jgi:addiction module RelE/StbE family toxin
MRIKFTKAFVKQYKKTPVKIQQKFDIKLDIFIDEEFAPVLNNHQLQGVWSKFRSINISGDWRAIYKYDSKDCLFVAIGTHSQLYK